MPEVAEPAQATNFSFKLLRDKLRQVRRREGRYDQMLAIKSLLSQSSG
jgi:hypothetical protein